MVTGAAGGIGRATATLLAEEGAALALVDVNHEALEGAEREVAELGADRLCLRLDCRDEDDMARMSEEILARFGRIDVLVAAAGLLRSGQPKPVAQLDVSDWDDVVDTNLRGVFLSNRAVLPTMMRQRHGQIVNVASIAAREPKALDAAYCASKAGVVGLSQAAAEEVRRYGIRVNAVLPGAVDTDLWEQNGPIPPPAEMLPPQRVAELIVFLLTLPDDTVLVDPVIAPFSPGRRQRPARRQGHRMSEVS